MSNRNNSGDEGIAGALNLSTPQVTLSGTSAGSIVCSEPYQGSSNKKVLCYLNGYENTTATAQTLCFANSACSAAIGGTNFAAAEYFAHDDSGGAAVSNSILTLPPTWARPRPDGSWWKDISYASVDWPQSWNELRTRCA